MKNVILFLVFVSIGFSASSQIGGRIIGKRKVKSTAVTVVTSEDIKLDRLAFSIARNSRSEKEKVQAIYRWIASNIIYDHELGRKTELQRQIYTSEKNVVQEALRREKALCGGFAFMFRDLCKELGIESEVIHGFTKDYAAGSKNKNVPHHTWNAVKLDGRWQLLDITWAIGHGAKNKPDDFWFLTSAEEFVYSHYPEDQKWTLLPNPISFIEFQNPKRK